MNKRCKCDDKRKRRRLKTLKRILIAILLALLLHGYTSNLNATIARQGDKIRDINNELRVTQSELKAVSNRVSTVQAAVVETKVALSTSKRPEANVTKSVGQREAKPVVNVKAREINEPNYVDPVSTFVVGGVLTIGKSIITNGGRLIGIN